MPASADEVTRAVLHEAIGTLEQSLVRIRHCLDQLTDEQIWWRPEESLNAIGNLVLHLAGNVRQWIVAGLGGTPDTRNRPAEFSERRRVTREELLSTLDSVVAEACEVLGRLNSAEMLGKRRIQGFDVTGWAALFDSVPHFKGHQQEIVSLTRQMLGNQYRFFWQPEGVEQGAPT
jgi:hypothetical protein